MNPNLGRNGRVFCVYTSMEERTSHGTNRRYWSPGIHTMDIIAFSQMKRVCFSLIRLVFSYDFLRVYRHVIQVNHYTTQHDHTSQPSPTPTSTTSIPINHTHQVPTTSISVHISSTPPPLSTEWLISCETPHHNKHAKNTQGQRTGSFLIIAHQHNMSFFHNQEAPLVSYHAHMILTSSICHMSCEASCSMCTCYVEHDMGA